MGRLDGSEENCCGVGRRQQGGRREASWSSEEEGWVVVMAMFGEGVVVLRSSSANMRFIVGQVPAITSQKHIESRNSREYSKKEKAKSTGVSGRALKK